MSIKALHNYVNQDSAANAGRPKVQLLLRTFRLAQITRQPYEAKSSILAKIVGAVYLGLSDWVIGVDLPIKTRVGPGLAILHTAGIVINGRARLGAGVTLLHGVTIGVLDAKRPGTPDIGDQVEICANALVAGDIQIGRGAFIGANSVVTRDVATLAVMTGNPGRFRRFRDESDLKPVL